MVTRQQLYRCARAPLLKHYLLVKQVSVQVVECFSFYPIMQELSCVSLPGDKEESDNSEGELFIFCMYILVPKVMVFLVNCLIIHSSISVSIIIVKRDIFC
jgi:hypothetical protein